MATKPNPTKTKPVIKGAAGGRNDRKRATKSDRLIQLLKTRSGRDIAALSGKLGWPAPFDPCGAVAAQKGRLRHREATAEQERQVALPDIQRAGRAGAMTVGKGARIEREIAALEALDRSALLQRWRSAFGRDAPPRLSRTLIEKAIAYDMQVRAFGGLSARTIRALKSAAKPAAAPASNRPPSRGARLVREWNGILHEVEVLDDGYLWREQRHRSLSAIALAITGTKWSGPRFFGVKGG
jgi:hypothetical protein